MKASIEKNRKWWILGTMTATIAMIYIDITVLPVILPTLQRELSISDLGLQWALNAYTLTLAVLVLAGGRLGDMIGLKKSFCGGLICFALASALCGMSRSADWLIFSRVLQGIGGAFLIPATQGIIASNFPPHQRGKATGLYVSFGTIFLATGPLIGGVLTSYFNWRYVFWINLPIAIIGLIMALLIVPPIKGKKEPFDFRGFLILALGLSCLIIGLMQTQEFGWISAPTVFSFCTGAFFLYLLFHRKDKKHASLIDFKLMKRKIFIASSCSIFCLQLIVMVSVFWAIYFQNILGFSPTKAGALAFLSNIPVLCSAPLSGFLVDRYGPRRPALIGFSLIICALILMLTFIQKGNVATLLPTLLLFGFGTPMILTPSMVAMRNDSPIEKIGVVTGTASALRQFSSSLGLSLFGTIYTSVYLSKLEQALRANLDTAPIDPKTLEGLLSKSANAMHTLDSLNQMDANYILIAAKNAFMSAFTYMNASALAVAFIGIIIVWKLAKNRPIHEPE